MDRFRLVKNPPDFRKKTPVGSQSVWKCKICKTNQAGYTCPRCNLPYCSVACYKAQAHAECSEAFYKDCVMEDLKSSRASNATKADMMKMLDKMQKEADEEPDILDAEDEPGDASLGLAERLADLDIDEADHEKIWERLNDDEKREFEEFLRSENLSEVIDLWEPWWTQPMIHPKVVEIDANNKSCFDLSDRPDIPAVIQAPDLSALFARHPPSSAVPLSVINFLYSYALITRIYNGDHRDQPEDVAGSFLDISCGLRGDYVLQSAEEAILRVLEDADKSSMKALMETRELRLRVMRDVLQIMEEDVFVEAAISDACLLFRKAFGKSKKKEYGNAFKKLEYFLAFIERDETTMAEYLPTLRMQQVDYADQTLQQVKTEALLKEAPKSVCPGGRPRIEEIS